MMLCIDSEFIKPSNVVTFEESSCASLDGILFVSIRFNVSTASVFCTPTGGKTAMEMENQTHNLSQDPSVVECPKLSNWSR